ncbi:MULTISPECIES: DUF4276 family protein [Amycolatopsis]|uniref:DUF4276 family protein n=1 Tax=Amycolatopsis bullii TaxID=941987 RepID=A0ABQ3KR08_9PSEU|nr:DUF4276 family protein [Amycolatopsis bullii]GHG45007.1 hypothetical protein GCM10017567_79350 [Amycolatopsis bullii]
MTVLAPCRLEVLVEEPSAEEALKALLPKIVPGVDFRIVPFNGKTDLLRQLPVRLRDYTYYWAETGLRIVVLLDRDNDDCAELKNRLVEIAREAGLPGEATLFRIVIEELEAWFLGDIPALNAAYPRLPLSLDSQTKFRDPENVPGGAWEGLEHALQKHGYHKKGLQKVGAAREIAPHMDIENNRSKSFQVFRDGLRRLVKEGN